MGGCQSSTDADADAPRPRASPPPQTTTSPPAAPAASAASAELETLWQPDADVVPLFQWRTTQRIPVRVVAAYDGDTVTALFAKAHLLDPAAPGVVKLKCRLARIDTPELKSKDPKEVQRACTARDTLIAWVVNQQGISAQLHGAEKYGRTLIELYRDGDNSNINDALCQQGLAQPYNGKGPRPQW